MRRLPLNTGQLQRYPIKPSAYLTTTLGTDELKNLNGVIYISTLKQTQNNYFYVFDVFDAQNINMQGLGNVNVVSVFLNTNNNTNPVRSTKISNWKQGEQARALMYAGIPMDSIEPINTQIFSNPMHTDITDIYFSNVEQFSLGIVAFYLKTYSGCSFLIEPGYVPLAGSTTTSTTTTGFYMKPYGVLDAALTINTLRDFTKTGYTGSNILGHLPDNGVVNFDVYDGSLHYSQATVPNDFFAPWSTPHIGNNFVISSANSRDGQYYVQYYVSQGALDNVTTTVPTTPKPTTPRHVETTTKVSVAILSGFPLMILMTFIKLL
ncbi:hypothetical protein GCK72_019192 [Caenorhabditis remanei]|uniref:CUB-like domain-containing protein n=1 Tax=Caenorhabditis remanei TaxID=31234 RepID=A0A6A5GBM1_CAERE|nr:hypothetical protein GCK72_019192 [Caenorhabditis remanei]KAF1752637.1 hypothetical protein GCK72_019192 [Caenorhabditis remanei]